MDHDSMMTDGKMRDNLWQDQALVTDKSLKRPEGWLLALFFFKYIPKS